MARKANYDEKITTITLKIDKKQTELRVLKEELEQLKMKKAKEDYKELTDFMTANKLSAADVLSMIS